MNEFIDYAYGWLDKVLSVTENGKPIASFNYHNDGQIAQAIHNGKSEDFLWDGLALIHRGETSFINEPYVTGGNPILSSKDGVMFNDMLGSTLNIGGKAVNMTAFGESADTNAMYTGKPMIDELGYSFLFRDYNPNQGKWTTADPLGYPDGWNNLAYVNNMTTSCVDFLGADIYHILASHAVGGFGHSAAIVGNDTFGYRIMNHGTTIGIGSSANNWATKYNSLSEALQALNSGRTGDDAFDKIQKWDTTSVQDDIAYQKMLERASHEYSEVTNNCWQVIQAGIYEAMYPLGSLYCSSSFVPSLAYLENYLNPIGPKSLDFNMVINGMIE